MSGHSHWATIKRKKETEDQKRGKVFSRLSREITLAAKTGADPESNAKLRLAIERARTANMPGSNIEKAIKKSASWRSEGKGGGLEEVVYEGFGPNSIAVIIEALTDNRQRTTAEIRKILERKGGSLAGPGAVVHQFQRLGLLTVKKTIDIQETILKIMDLANIEDVIEAEDVIEVYTQPNYLETVRQALLKIGLEIKSFSLIWQPRTPQLIKKGNAAEQALNLMNELEEQADVQAASAAFEIHD